MEFNYCGAIYGRRSPLKDCKGKSVKKQYKNVVVVTGIVCVVSTMILLWKYPSVRMLGIKAEIGAVAGVVGVSLWTAQVTAYVQGLFLYCNAKKVITQKDRVIHRCLSSAWPALFLSTMIRHCLLNCTYAEWLMLWGGFICVLKPWICVYIYFP